MTLSTIEITNVIFEQHYSHQVFFLNKTGVMSDAVQMDLI